MLLPNNISGMVLAIKRKSECCNCFLCFSHDTAFQSMLQKVWLHDMVAKFSFTLGTKINFIFEFGMEKALYDQILSASF